MRGVVAEHRSSIRYSAHVQTDVLARGIEYEGCELYLIRQVDGSIHLCHSKFAN